MIEEEEKNSGKSKGIIDAINGELRVWRSQQGNPMTEETFNDLYEYADEREDVVKSEIRPLWECLVKVSLQNRYFLTKEGNGENRITWKELCEKVKESNYKVGDYYTYSSVDELYNN